MRGGESTNAAAQLTRLPYYTVGIVGYQSQSMVGMGLIKSQSQNYLLSASIILGILESESSAVPIY